MPIKQLAGVVCCPGVSRYYLGGRVKSKVDRGFE